MNTNVFRNGRPTQYETRATARRHKVYVVRSEEVNESGFVADTSFDFGPYWASVVPLSERMRTSFKSVSVAASHCITMSGAIDLKEKDRIRFKDRIFDVVSVRDAAENGRDQIVITQEIRPGQEREEQ